MPKVLNFRVIIEQDEDKFFIAKVPAIPGCYTQGKTYEEAIKMAEDVIKLCLEEAREDPNYKSEIDFSDTKDRFIGITNIPVKMVI